MMGEDNNPKDVEYYSNTVNAWYTTKLERDRSILFISSGGLGVLISILSFYGINNVTEMLLYFLSMLLFTISIISMIIIFQKNADYLEYVICEKDTKKQSKILSIFDNLGFYSFIMAILLSFILGCSIIFNITFINLEERMDEKKSGIPLKKSFNRAEKIKPSTKQPSQTQTNFEKPAIINQSNVEQSNTKKTGE